jgi:hypothetical protein
VPDPGSGRLKLWYPKYSDADEESKRIFNSSFTLATDPDFSYKSLEDAHFDPSLFAAELFCPTLLQNHPGLEDGDPYATSRTTFAKGIALPVMAAQVAFIPDGLVLSVWTHHSVADGTGAQRVCEVWSQKVREGRRETEAVHISMPEILVTMGGSSSHGITHTGITEKEDTALAFDMLARSSTPEPNLDASTSPTDTVALHDPTDTVALHDPTYSVSAALFRFDHNTITSLRTQLSTTTNTRISPFRALAAMLWAHIIQLRSPKLHSHGITASSLAVVVDLRPRLGAPFTNPDYIGNCVLSAKPQHSLPSPLTSIPATQSLTAQDISPLATSIFDALQSFTSPAITSRLTTLISSTVSPPITDCQALQFTNGQDLYITDWRRVGMDNECDIPGTSSSRPTAIRRACWKGEGGIILLPRRKDGDDEWEVMVSLEEEELRALEKGLRRGDWLVHGESEKKQRLGRRDSKR